MDPATPIQKDLAKLTLPNLPDVLLRNRLFQDLDHAIEFSAVWIAAPGGSGKTVLVASYLSDRNLNALWYRVDEGDQDVASFFYYLGVALREAAPHIPARLPHLTLEYQQGLTTFARSFFRQMFSSMEKPGVVVFDNFQDVGEDALLHQIMEIALHERPKDIAVIIISRNDPSPSFSRLRTNGLLHILESESVRFNEEEIAALYKHRKGIIPERDVVETLYQRTRGWVTGLVLMMENPVGRDQIRDGSILVDYFAGEILDRSDTELRQFLLRTSFLIKFDPGVAQDLSGNEDASRILQDLVKHHYFTYQSGPRGESYEYHPLFREFLMNRVPSDLSEEEIYRIKRRSARFLFLNGMINEAVDLYTETSSWKELIELIVKEAPAQYASGRWLTLARWIAVLPVDLANEQAWLVFWRGSATLPIDAGQARKDLKTSYQLFIESEEMLGAYMAWCASVETYSLFWGNFSDLDYWINEGEYLLSLSDEYPSPEIEAHFTSGIFSALMWRQTESPKLASWAARNETLFDKPIDKGLKLVAGYHATLHEIWLRGNFVKTRLIYEHLKRTGQKDDVAIVPRLLWHVTEAACCYALNDLESSIGSAQQGIALAENTGVNALSYLLHVQAIYAYLAAGNQQGASTELASLHSLMERVASFDYAHYYYLCAWRDLNKGNIDDAIENIGLAHEAAIESGGSLYIPFAQVAESQVFYEAGRNKEAEGILQDVEQWGDSSGNNMIKVHGHLLRALMALDEGKLDQCDENLATAIRICREQHYKTIFWIGWRQPIISRLFMRCLERNIDSCYVQQLIQESNLKPPEKRLTENWPFPVRIRALGTFKVYVNNEELRFSGKAQKKPLELMQALVACGPQGVSGEKLCDALWADSDGDAAAQNLKAAVHRLRKLVGKDAVLQESNTLSLSSQQCWVDLWAFESLLDKLESGGANYLPGEIIHMIDQAIDLYRGHLLIDESESSWAISAREKTRQRWYRIIQELVKALASENQCEKTISLYRKGLEVDDLSEEFYYGLMACQAGQGNRAEALATYKRCCEIFNKTLGIDPSDRLQQLHQQILNQDESQLSTICSACRHAS